MASAISGWIFTVSPRAAAAANSMSCEWYQGLQKKKGNEVLCDHSARGGPEVKRLLRVLLVDIMGGKPEAIGDVRGEI